MKILLLAILALVSVSARGQFVFVLTHGGANTPEFRTGCPTNWPYRTIKSDTNTLPAGEALPERGDWLVWTEVQLTNVVAELTPLKEAWNKAQEIRELPALVWSAKEFDERVEAMAPGAWDRLEDMAVDPEITPETRRIIRAAIRLSSKAVEVVSTNPETIRFMAMAVAVGVLTQDQADHILGKSK